MTRNPATAACCAPCAAKPCSRPGRGKEPLGNGLALIAAHADTPRLDLKQRPLIEQPGVAQAKTHYYGGIRKYQWLARPLALHGVIVRENGESLAVSIGEKPGEPVFCIADLLPHLAQKQSAQTVSEAFEAEKLNIILAHSPKSVKKGKADGKDAPKEAIKEQLLALLHKKYGINEEDLITAELQAVPAGPARFVGFDKALVGGYGQDDRICVFTALEALLAAEDGPRNMAVIFWDKEEIGSDGATGAASRFFQYCVEDLARSWAPGTPASHVLLHSRALSADVQAALDPDFRTCMKNRTRLSWATGPASPNSRARAANTEPARRTPNFSANCAVCTTPGASLGRLRNWAEWTWAAAARWRSFSRPTACASLTWGRPCFPCTAPLSWRAARIFTPPWKPTGHFWRPEQVSSPAPRRGFFPAAANVAAAPGVLRGSTAYAATALRAGRHIWNRLILHCVQSMPDTAHLRASAVDRPVCRPAQDAGMH